MVESINVVYSTSRGVSVRAGYRGGESTNNKSDCTVWYKYGTMVG